MICVFLFVFLFTLTALSRFFGLALYLLAPARTLGPQFHELAYRGVPYNTECLDSVCSATTKTYTWFTSWGKGMGPRGSPASTPYGDSKKEQSSWGEKGCKTCTGVDFQLPPPPNVTISLPDQEPLSLWNLALPNTLGPAVEEADGFKPKAPLTTINRPPYMRVAEGCTNYGKFLAAASCGPNDQLPMDFNLNAAADAYATHYAAIGMNLLLYRTMQYLTDFDFQKGILRATGAVKMKNSTAEVLNMDGTATSAELGRRSFELAAAAPTPAGAWPSGWLLQNQDATVAGVQASMQSLQTQFDAAVSELGKTLDAGGLEPSFTLYMKWGGSVTLDGGVGSALVDMCAPDGSETGGAGAKVTAYAGVQWEKEVGVYIVPKVNRYSVTESAAYDVLVVDTAAKWAPSFFTGATLSGRIGGFAILISFGSTIFPRDPEGKKWFRKGSCPVQGGGARHKQCYRDSLDIVVMLSYEAQSELEGDDSWPDPVDKLEGAAKKVSPGAYKYLSEAAQKGALRALVGPIVSQSFCLWI
jgi:hypothetical protein